MSDYYHTFHIPVMGIGHSIDTPIYVAPFGITSVISLVDDLLLEKMRKYYTGKFGLPYTKIPKNAEDGRSKRITAYLDTVLNIVQHKIKDMRTQSLFASRDKRKYFELLPGGSPLRKKYINCLGMKAGYERDAVEKDLTDRMLPGSIDVNIMVRLDKTNYDRNGNPLNDEFNDAKAALRGYANSALQSAIVFSAGFNQRLFKYMTRFIDFYRDEKGNIKKRIILKVSNFRSAYIQGKYLATKGLEVYEYRVESGLNCGGHSFPTNGLLLPSLLKEFKAKRNRLVKELQPLVQTYYKKKGWKYIEPAAGCRPLISVQGGIGTHGEVQRLFGDFDVDRTGWASPFLLVPEVTRVDDVTRNLLRQAKKKDLFLSDVSPLNIPFNNVRDTGSERWTKQRVKQGRPGSPCPKNYLVSNTEFTKKPVCLASRQYQKAKLQEIHHMATPSEEKKRLARKVVEKTCICDHLGNSALIALGIATEKHSPQAVCPGPNIAWFNKFYTLNEMIDHIYGRISSLVSAQRPHLFAEEMVMYVDYFEKKIDDASPTPNHIKTLWEFKNNLEAGIDLCLEISQKEPYQGENLASLYLCAKQQKARLQSMVHKLQNKSSYC